MDGKKQGENPEMRKSFLRRHEIPIIIVLTLIFIYTVFFLNQKINFFLGNEMIVHLNPMQKSVSMHYSNESFLTFDVSIENSANCRASCSYSFYDRSRNTAVDTGEFKIKKDENVQKNYTITARRAGSGQDIYSFDISCKSVASIICLSSSKDVARSSFITVNYDLSEEEKQLKQALKNEIIGILFELKEADESFSKLSQRSFELGKKINLREISQAKTEIENELNSLVLETQNIKSTWSLEDYKKIDSMIDDSFLERITEIKNSIDLLDTQIDSYLSQHNRLLQTLWILSAKINITSKNANSLGKSEAYNISDITSRFNKISNEVTNNTHKNHTSASFEIDILNENANFAISSMQAEFFNLFNEMNYFLEYENRLLCSLSGCGHESTMYDDAQNFLGSYPDASLKCDELTSLDKKLFTTRNSLRNLVFPNHAQFLDSASEVYENKKAILNNSITDEFTQKNIAPEIRNSFSLVVPKNKTAVSAANETDEIKNYMLSKINFSDSKKYEELKNACKLYSNPAYKVQDFDFSNVNDEMNYTIISRINATLSDNPPICCVFSECNPCCTSNDCKSQSYPVIFLHGHAFSSGNSPEFSLDAFNKIQSRMQDDGYINAGIVSVYSKNQDSQDGVWGISGKPVTVKASYYYDAISHEDDYIIIPTKSESIDTYALRLKDIVDVVKQRTGKEKVNIVAHSMGGLVARKYLQIFGESNVEKLIMVATPNEGIGGRANDFCSFVGENLECRDMSKGSIFISKLNDPQKQPANIKIYNIIGTGCMMKTGDGDGVVLAEDVELPYANNFYIEGKCTGVLGEQLHTELLNIDRYNATYERIRNALQS